MDLGGKCYKHITEKETQPEADAEVLLQAAMSGRNYWAPREMLQTFYNTTRADAASNVKKNGMKLAAPTYSEFKSIQTWIQKVKPGFDRVYSIMHYFLTSLIRQKMINLFLWVTTPELPTCSLSGMQLSLITPTTAWLYWIKTDCWTTYLVVIRLHFCVRLIVCVTDANAYFTHCTAVEPVYHLYLHRDPSKHGWTWLCGVRFRYK